MPRKRDFDRTYGQKLITLFTRLLFSGESHSLTELARMLACSKQTVLRLVDDISSSYQFPLAEETRGNKKFYSVKHNRNVAQAASFSGEELQLLEMCRVFTAHLLGPQLFEEAAQALLKSQTFLANGQTLSHHPFASFRPGTIDYTPHQGSLQTLIQAMTTNKVCKVTYQKLMDSKPKTYFLKPLKLFSHQDTIYLHARKAKQPGKAYEEPKYDPLFAIHRIKKVEITERGFEFPKDYDFEKIFNRHFGVMKDKAFEVEAEFSGWAARFVAERIWSPDQKMVKKGRGKIRISFTASSGPEVIGRILFFGEEAKLLKPDWLVEEIREKVRVIKNLYQKIK